MRVVGNPAEALTYRHDLGLLLPGLRASDKSTADRALANANVGRRSCDLEATKFVDGRQDGSN